MSPNNKLHRCKAKTKTGKPCRAAATAGGLCFFHANPDKAAELGRRGGQANRHGSANNADPLPTLDNVTAVRDMLARLIADVHAKRLPPRIAAGLAPLLSLQLRAIAFTEDREAGAPIGKAGKPSCESRNLGRRQRRDVRHFGW